MSTQFPNAIDTDNELPPVSDNITEIGSEAINALRSAMFAVETSLGLNSQGSAASLAARVNVALNPDGSLKASALTSAGLLASPLRNAQVASDAAIVESKLHLDFPTAALAGSINTVISELDELQTFRATTGVKIEPHINGSDYNHDLANIDVGGGALDRVNISIGQTIARNLNDAYGLVAGISIDLLDHTRADGGTNQTTPPADKAHNASGIGLNTSNFSFIPQTENDLQKFAQYIDGSNLLVLGTKYQTLYNNGIPRSSRSTALNSSTTGQSLIPYTPAITYLLSGGSSTPVDNIDSGDDCILFNATDPSLDGYNFTAAFHLVKPGDLATINYTVIENGVSNSVTVSFPIKEKKSSGSTFLIRIDGKNIYDTSDTSSFTSTNRKDAAVRIDKSLYNIDKQGVLALAQAPLPASISAYPSLIIANPRGAEAVSVGFNPDLIDSNHYYLYLQLFPTGNPVQSTINLARIDVSGNLGATPGLYTLESVVASINKAFRTPGYNYRFVASSFKGELIIKLADSINNASFSIIAGAVNASGAYDQSLTNTTYSSMAINVFDGKDALGFGPSAANLASPPFSLSYASAAAASIPVRIIAPLSKKTFYVNGAERERLASEPNQTQDANGEGYWEAQIVAKTLIASSRVRVTYQVNLNLTLSSLAPGKTILVQNDGYGSIVDFGRYTIETVQFNTCNCDGYDNYAQITVYDAVHSTGITPYVTTGIGSKVRLYFGSDSVSFSNQNASDLSANALFKRWFEIYVDSNGNTFSYERGRKKNANNALTISSSVFQGSQETFNFDLVSISPKLRGYKFGASRKINLLISAYDTTSGVFSGYLRSFDGTTESNKGPVTVGKKGNVVRFYDETYIDYIDVILDINTTIASFTNKQSDIQLFRSFQLDKEYFYLGSCQIDDITKNISQLRDGRDFGNTGEDQLSTSALNYIAAPIQLLNENGIIRGFELTSVPTNATPYPNAYAVTGGVAIINGKIVQVNNQFISVPLVVEDIGNTGVLNATINWFLCVNEKAELEWIANTDFDISNSNYASVDHNRIFYVNNQNASFSTSYAVRGTYLANLVSNYRDLAPIALVSATVSSQTGGTTAYVLSAGNNTDLRRYTTFGSGGMTEALVFGPQSSFRSMDSVLAWLNQLSNFKSSATQDNPIGRVVIVKGENTIAKPYTLSFNSKITFRGEGGTFSIPIATGLNLGSNVSFENVRFKYTYDATADSNFFANNPINATSSALRMTTPGGIPSAPMTLKNVSITKCHFISPYNNHFAFFACNFVGESDRVESLNVSDNRFDCTSTTDNSLYPGGDIQAAVAIYSSRTALPTSATRIVGQRLINGLIENNICNKNQIISIAGTSVGNTNIFDSVVPVNVKIRNNLCGAINFCVKQDVPQVNFSSDNTQANLYRESSITISGNSCNYIFTGDANGKYVPTLGVSAFSLINFYTPPTNILDNIVSYIHTGIKLASGYNQNSGSIIIRGNKMSPGSDSCLNPYGYSGFAANAPSIIVDKGII